MLFGRGGDERVSMDQLDGVLDASFNRKLGALENRASSITRDMERARSRFEGACSDFEKLNAEPEKRNMYINDMGVIKSQKQFYSNALKRITDTWEVSAQSPNIYAKYNAILGNAQEFINETLKANKSFNSVLFSYSNHLDNLKRTFSTIERHAESLRNELNRVHEELSEYNSVSEGITKLKALQVELEAIRKGVGALSENVVSKEKGGTGNEEAEILDNISKARAELAGTNASISGLVNKITSVTMPLERPSRKLDHISPRKRPLLGFIEDPIGRIKNDSDYKEFTMLIEELRKSVDSGSIDAKNAAKTNEDISRLLNADIYAIMLQIDAMKGKRSGLEEIIRSLEISLERLRRDRGNSEKAVKDIESMKANMANLEAGVNIAKGQVEQLFMKHYNRKLLIVAGK